LIRGIEFLAGFACLAVGLTVVSLALRRGNKIVSVSFYIAVFLDLCVFSTLFMDWAYSWVHRVAFFMAIESNIWVALPHAMVLFTLFMFLVWGVDTVPWAVVVKTIQAFSFIPVIFFAGLDTDTSMLSAAPLFAMFASMLAAFLFLPAAFSVIPPRDSRWFDIAFGPRNSLIDSIDYLSQSGLSVIGPSSVFESGSATGKLGDTLMEVDSAPSLVPLAYALRIRWTRSGLRPDLSVRHSLPGFTDRESLESGDGFFEYHGLSSSGFDVTGKTLLYFMESVDNTLSEHPSMIK